MIKRYFSMLMCLFLTANITGLNQGLTSYGSPPGPGTSHLGHEMLTFCIAKILSYKYNIPYFYVPFENAEIFTLHEKEMPSYLEREKRLKNNEFKLHYVEDISHLTSNLHQNNMMFIIGLKPIIQDVKPEWVDQLKSEIRLKDHDLLEKTMPPLPHNKITVAIHIRKGNGGQYNDGYQTSPQLFNHDLNRVEYVTNGINYAFDWGSFVRTRAYQVDKQWPTKFPPEQFYIDQINKLYNEVNQAALHIEVFTDDINPPALVERLQRAINRNNINFHYHDYRNLPHQERIKRDLFGVARTQVLIRSESGFSRIAQLMGNHLVAIYPLNHRLEGNKVIMSRIFINGSFKSLL